MSYKIIVKNKSSATKDFFVFASAPEVSSGSKVFRNVFLSGTVAGGGSGSVTFQFKRELYAVCGKKKLQNGAEVTETFPSTALKLGTELTKGTTLAFRTTDNAAQFVTPYPAPDAGPGNFRIKTGTDFNQGDHYFLGMGNKADANSDVLPVAVVEASPNATFDFTPHIIYYVATGSFKPGTIFDVTVVGETKELDFTGGADSITAIYNPNGTWT